MVPESKSLPVLYLMKSINTSVIKTNKTLVKTEEVTLCYRVLNSLTVDKETHYMKDLNSMDYMMLTHINSTNRLLL